MLAAIARSVRSKLLVVVIVTTFSALAVVSGALMVYDLRTYEQSRVSDLTTLADVLAAASAAPLAFNARREAEQTLNLLRVRPLILAGALHDTSGAAFASYSPENLPQNYLLGLGGDGYAIKNQRLLVAKSIFDRNERIGTLYLVARYEARQRLLDSGAIFGGVFLLSMLIAVLVSTWLGRTLSQPIQEITDAAHRVMEHRDFSVRVRKTTQDEIGYLVDAFNSMLDEVGRRSATLEEDDRRKDQFLAVLAHELRNPLSPIRNAVFVLQLAKSDIAKVTWAGEVIDRQIRILARLLDDLLDVARIRQNKIELRLQVVDLRPIVETAVESARPAFDANAQSLELNLPAEPVYVRGDPTRLAQVLGNILNNAAKYTERGGQIRLTAFRRGGDIVLATKDSGIGLAHEHLSRVFEMFTQVPTDRSKAAGGLGIGLALVRALVEMHGGTVEARSEGMGKGSEFIVTLPCAIGADDGPHEARAALGGEDSAALKVLVADDVPDSVDTLRTALELLGHQVWTASDGTAALETAMRVQPDVAILDIGMPGLTGYEVAAGIRETHWGKRAKLIALTGWGQRHDIAKARAAGFNHHVTKPADLSMLEQVIRRTSLDQ